MTYIDWNVIFLIMGMMIVIAVVENTGIFQWLAFFAYRVSGGRMWLLLAKLAESAQITEPDNLKKAGMVGGGMLILFITGESFHMLPAGIADSAGYTISYPYFFKKGFPALLLTVSLALIWLLFKFA